MDLAFMAAAVPLLLPGFGVTVLASMLALVAATGLGVVSGAARALVSNRNPMAWLIDIQIFLVRGTPIIVQVFAGYFLLPVIGLRLPPFWVGTMVLAFNSLGYQTEIARNAMSTVGAGQRDAAAALGLKDGQSLWLIVIPQAFRQMIPGLMNEASQLIKASSVLSVIAVFELHKAASAIVGNTFRFAEVLTVESLFYLTLVGALGALAIVAEKRFASGAGSSGAYQVR